MQSIKTIGEKNLELPSPSHGHTITLYLDTVVKSQLDRLIDVDINTRMQIRNEFHEMTRDIMHIRNKIYQKNLPK